MAEELDFRILSVFLSVATEVSCTLQILQGSGESEGWLAKRNPKKLLSCILGIFA